MKFPSFNYKGFVKLIVKIFFTGAILYWLVSQNKLDFKLAGISLPNPALRFTCFAILAAQIVVGATRWRLFLKTYGIHFPTTPKSCALYKKVMLNKSLI